MPIDVSGLRRFVAIAYAPEPHDEERPRGANVREGEPVQIWHPETGNILHPLDAVEWPRSEELHPEITEDGGADGQLREYGTDLLAWYQPFHLHPSTWGIYIREWGLDYLARRLGDRPHLALRALWAHEYLHFLTEVAASSIEVVTGKATFLMFVGPDHRAGSGCQVEEAIANAFALDQVGRRHGKGLLRKFMQGQPVGYRDFNQFERRPNSDGLTRGYRQLGEHLVALTTDKRGPCVRSGGELPLGELLVDEAGAAVVPGDVPIYFVPRARQTTFVRFIPAISSIQETRRFQKDLERLPRTAQTKWEEVKEALRRSTRESGMNFEKVGSGRYSVRLNQSIRAILDSRDGDWIAVAIGPHDTAYHQGARRARRS